MAFKDVDIQSHMAGLDFRAQTVGIEDLERNLETVFEHIVRSAQFTCKISARVVLFNSRHHVPYDSGDLFNSSDAKDVTVQPDKPTWEVSYDWPYAVIVHERPVEHIQGKGPYPQFEKTSKFLENASKDQEAKFPEDVAAAIDAAINGQPIPVPEEDTALSGGGLGSGIGRPRLVKKR